MFKIIKSRLLKFDLKTYPFNFSAYFNKFTTSYSSREDFIQKQPVLPHPFLADAPLRTYLKHHLTQEVFHEISQDLEQFGSQIINEIDDLGWQCELHPPSLETHDAWGKRIDQLTTCNAWKQQHAISAKEGLVAIAYEQKLGVWSRLHQICKLYLYAPSSGLYSCPLAMTDGAAKAIKIWMDLISEERKNRFKNAFYNLISRDPEKFWSSGQWMTEKRGGSDVVSSTETIAIEENGHFRLHGYKWFSSATDSDIALTLARVVHNDKPFQVSNDLTLFYVETKNSDGQLNNIQIAKLKKKLGTRQLPTAELFLNGCIAHKMFDEGRGIAAISDMLNITRLHNAVSAVACMRRIMMLTRNYGKNRIAFGQKLVDIPLHMHILSKMEKEVRGSLLLLLKVALLLGKKEISAITSEEMLLLRILSPILKLYTAKQAVSLTSEGLETFGGQGYIEDTKLPIMLRDAQVLPIWEGTTNVLSMDVIRCLKKSNNEALLTLQKSLILNLEKGKHINNLAKSCMKVEKSMAHILNFVGNSSNLLDIAARDLAYSLARTYIGGLLIENAALTKKDTDIYTAQQWCEMQDMCLLLQQENYLYFKQNDYKVVLESCEEN